jgi:hypothetical protein
MAKEPDFHLDIFEQEIRKGDFVATNWYGSDLQVCVVKKLSPKMVQISRVITSDRSYRNTKNKYPKEMLVVNGEDVTMYILKNSGKRND